MPCQGPGQQGASRGVGGPHLDLVPDPQGLPSAFSAVSPSDFVISGDLQPDQKLLRLTWCLGTRLCQGTWGRVESVGNSWKSQQPAGVSSALPLPPPQGHSKSIQCLTVHKNGGKSYIYSGSHDGHINIL